MSKSRKSANTESPTPPPKELTVKVRLFIAEYQKDWNGAQAYMRSHPGCTYETARVEASRLLKRDDVRDEIERALQERVKRAGLQADEVLLELKRMVHFDPRRLFSKTGMPLDISELDDETSRAIAGLEVQEEWEGTGENRKFIGFTKKYKLIDRNSAVEKAMRHLGLNRPEQIDHSGEINVRIVDYRSKKPESTKKSGK